ncbi:MAG: ABC transporter permease [Planctomycetota bacterium]|nr:ABC transporter permease [Planctomycetota bacterium]
MGASLWIGWNTCIETVRQPVFYLLTAVMGLVILTSPAITLFVMRDSTPLIVEMGIGTVTLSGLILTILISWRVVTEEIEKKTALTILSKPISRESFLIGKFLGVLTTVHVSAGLLLSLLIFTVWFQGGEANRSTAGFWSMWSSYGHVILSGGALACLQLMVLVAASVAVASYFGLVVNACIMAAFFSAGHLSGYLVSGIGTGWLRSVVSWAFLLIPDLEVFNIGWAATQSRSASFQYVGFAASYAVVYSLVFLLTAMCLFRRRELM